MSRFSKQHAYYFTCQKLGVDFYRLGWTVDRYVKGSRLRFPTGFHRDTDEAGARRFCKRHGIDFTEEKK